MKNLMERLSLLTASLLLVFATTVRAEGSKRPAFPGAEGFGRYAKGGRGGDVYHVTNLHDDGPGSLRYGIATADNPRTIIFDVAGTIQLATPIRMENKSHLTIAGQTAPGKGITIRDHAMAITKCSDIVVRYLRLRLGDKNKGDSSGEDVMTVDDCDQVILDHLSLSWGIDGNSDYRGNSNMTLQWLLYAEALHNSIHDKGSHAMCTSLRDCQGNTTLHHNIYSTSRDRHPTIGGGTGSKSYAQVVVDYRNCVNFNWRGPTNFGGMRLNVVNNYYKPGPCSDLDAPPMQMKDGDTTKAKGFMVGNHFEGMPKRFNEDNYCAVLYTNSGSYMSTSRGQWASDEPFDLGDFQPHTQIAPEAYETCLRYTGCSLVRDRVDERIIENVITGTGEVIDSQDQVGGWDRYPEVRRPDDWDIDRDGIPSAWENTHGLDPRDPADRNGDTDGDGYTNLEEYMNSLVQSLKGQGADKEKQPFPRFQAHLIDRLPRGYKVGAADIDRDGKLDVIGLATEPSSLVWYKNPSWERYVLTSRAKAYIDLAPYDIDRDGRTDMVIAHDFGMSRTGSGGLVHWLRCPEDPTQEWPMDAVGAEPTSHRIRWADIDGDGRKELVNAPIMGRNAKAPLWEVGVNLLWYEIPEAPGLELWKPHVIDDQLTVVHGISVVNWDNDGCDDILVASFEGIHLFQPQNHATDVPWTKTKLGVGEQVNPEKRGSSEIAAGKIGSESRRFLAAIEPWHGNNVVVYTPNSGSNILWHRSVIDGTFNEGHALTCADLDADGDDEIIAGYRGKGYSLYIYDCQDSTGEKWKRIALDEGDMAASGLDIADVNSDGRLDVICVGTATSNIKWYENLGVVRRDNKN